MAALLISGHMPNRAADPSRRAMADGIIQSAPDAPWVAARTDGYSCSLKNRGGTGAVTVTSQGSVHSTRSNRASSR